MNNITVKRSYSRVTPLRNDLGEQYKLVHIVDDLCDKKTKKVLVSFGRQFLCQDFREAIGDHDFDCVTNEMFSNTYISVVHPITNKTKGYSRLNVSWNYALKVAKRQRTWFGRLLNHLGGLY